MPNAPQEAEAQEFVFLLRAEKKKNVVSISFFPPNLNGLSSEDEKHE